jgi:DnaJ-class molecular chaperone
MSNLSKPILEIYPPVLTAFTKKNETFTSGGHICPCCNGEGLIWGKQISIRDYNEDTCPICGGTGSLQAVISIQWVLEKASN